MAALCERSRRRARKDAQYTRGESRKRTTHNLSSVLHVCLGSDRARGGRGSSVHGPVNCVAVAIVIIPSCARATMRERSPTKVRTTLCAAKARSRPDIVSTHRPRQPRVEQESSASPVPCVAHTSRRRRRHQCLTSRGDVENAAALPSSAL